MTAKEAFEAAALILPQARGWARRTSTDLDEEICQNLAACLLDLQKEGITRLDVNDPLIQQAAKLYLHANFGSKPDAERWERAYGSLKDSLALSGDYNGGVQVDT